MSRTINVIEIAHAVRTRSNYTYAQALERVQQHLANAGLKNNQSARINIMVAEDIIKETLEEWLQYED